jgi:hypothetical protein
MRNTFLAVFVLGVPAYMAFEIVRGYTTATGTAWQRLVAAFKGSATIFWARLNALSVAAIGTAGEIATIAGAPGVADTIKPWLAPEYMMAYTLFVLIGAEIARRRTLA